LKLDIPCFRGKKNSVKKIKPRIHGLKFDNPCFRGKKNSVKKIKPRIHGLKFDIFRVSVAKKNSVKKIKPRIHGLKLDIFRVSVAKKICCGCLLSPAISGFEDPPLYIFINSRTK
jgi:hypothetical protein